MNEHQESEDEERYNFSENTHYHLKQAFSNVKHDKSKWIQKYQELLIEEDVFKNVVDFNEYVSTKDFKIRGFFKYSLNPIDDIGQAIHLEASYFPKLIILINLLFEISYMYQYQFDTDYKVSIFDNYLEISFNDL